jgi:hypothetical protein
LIGVGCISSAAYAMRATVLGQKMETDPETQQVLRERRDRFTGEVIREWETIIVPGTDGEAGTDFEFDCAAEAVITGGLNTQGTAERFTSKGKVETVDFVIIRFSPKIILNRRMQITNLRNKRTGEVLWVEEEQKDEAGDYIPTIFNVNGVSPVTDIFGNHIENYALLSRAEVQAEWNSPETEDDNG